MLSNIKPFLSKKYFNFWNYVVERQRIWYRRDVLKEPYPWTNDLILKKYHFCNNYRELDRGSIYLINKLNSLQNLQNDREKILFNVVAYRIFNFYGFFDKIGGFLDPSAYDPFVLIEKLDELKTKGEIIFHVAYVVPHQIVSRDYRPEEKHVQYAFLLENLGRRIGEIVMKIDKTTTPKESFEMLKRILGFGNFLTYEVWTDLTYFQFFNQGWTDNDFVNVGPGAKWGLNIMMGKDIKSSLLPEGKYVKQIYKLRDEMEEGLGQLGLLSPFENEKIL